MLKIGIPLTAFLELNTFHKEHGIYTSNTTHNICTSNGWNFASKYFLPSPNYRLRFVQSEYNGMLLTSSVNDENATSIAHDYSNSNEHKLLNDTDCHFIFNRDLNVNNGSEVSYALQSKDWTKLEYGRYVSAGKLQKRCSIFPG